MADIQIAKKSDLEGKANVVHNHDGVYQPVGDYADKNHAHSYNDLTDNPTIPTNNNQLTNGANYITNAYDNSTSGLTATDIQDAIDELKTLIDGLNTPVE